MNFQTAAKKMRKWQKDGIVVKGDGFFIHKSTMKRSQESFIYAVKVLNGEIINEFDFPLDYRTLATLPDDALPLVEPRPGPGRPKGTKGGGRPKLPEGEHRVQQGARFHPDTKPLAEAIANALGLDNWAWAVDEAIKRMAKEEGIKIE